ncbi:MAG: choice-of-anchor E domain-containing protein [Isosphaeraceae bacterium]
MGRSKIVFKLFCLVAFWLSQHAADAGQILTPLQTQSIAPPGVLIPTDWGPGTTGIKDPLSFNQFDPRLGTLEAVDVTMSTTIRNDYILTFVPTPIETTLYVATSATSAPSILADPSQREKLTDGPTVILNAPDGIGQIFGPPATRQPVDFVTLTESSGTWQSQNPYAPNFIPPTVTNLSLSRTLDTSNAPPSLLSEFTGTGKVDLPLTATAFSSFFTDSGNGSGTVLTTANATVTVQYVYSIVPEPSSAILAILGIGTTCLLFQLRRRAVQRRGCSSDRSRTGSDIDHV